MGGAEGVELDEEGGPWFFGNGARGVGGEGEGGGAAVEGVDEVGAGGWGGGEDGEGWWGGAVLVLEEVGCEVCFCGVERGGGVGARRV